MIFLSFGSLLTAGYQKEEGRSLGPSLAFWDARGCFGEGDQAELNIVEDQAPPNLGMETKEVYVRILMRDLLASLSLDNLGRLALLKSQVKLSCLHKP